MKNRHANIRFVLLLVALIWMPVLKILPQGTDMGLERKPGAFVGISVGALNSHIFNESTLDIEEVASSGKMSFSGSLDIGYLFSKSLGLRTGLGYHTSEIQISLDDYQSSFDLKDSENETYEMRVTASDISEIQTLKILSMPLTLVLNIPLADRVSIYIEPGINLSFPINNNFSSSGIYTYKGYYPEYNVVLENLPDHGFSTNQTIKEDDNLELKNVWTDLIASTGINFTLKRKIQVLAGVNYSTSLTNISGYSSAETFELSPTPGQVISLMGASEDVSSKSLGFSIAFRYFINR